MATKYLGFIKILAGDLADIAPVRSYVCGDVKESKILARAAVVAKMASSLLFRQSYFRNRCGHANHAKHAAGGFGSADVSPKFMLMPDRMRLRSNR
jgi:hypothetical protein